MGRTNVILGTVVTRRMGFSLIPNACLLQKAQEVAAVI